jgi:hypothetical protein
MFSSFFDDSPLYRVIENALQKKRYLEPTAIQSISISIPYFLHTDNE